MEPSDGADEAVETIGVIGVSSIPLDIDVFGVRLLENIPDDAVDELTVCWVPSEVVGEESMSMEPDLFLLLAAMGLLAPLLWCGLRK